MKIQRITQPWGFPAPQLTKTKTGSAGKQMLCSAALLSALCLPLPAALADSGTGTQVSVTGSTLYSGGSVSKGSSYSRVIRLQYSGSANGRLLATFENFTTQNFGIYESDDDGVTWTGSPIGVASEQKLGAGWNFEWQPHLFELPQQLNDLPAGTLLLAGDSIGPSGQQIELYTSSDQGHSWHYRSTIDANSTPGVGIWEPNLQIASNGNLVAYFSDERQKGQGFNQLLGERQSTDGGLTWGPEQNIVAINDGNQRPGMAVTAKLPNGQYVMSFEAVGSGPGSPVHIKFSSDGINWGSGPGDYGIAIKTASGSYLGATPYIMWSPLGGVNGTLFVSAQNLSSSPNSDRELMINTNLGQGNWTMLPSPVQWQGGSDHAGWSQAMIPTADGSGIIHLASSSVGSDINAMLVGRETVILPGQTYTVVNQNSGEAVDVPGGTNVHGTALDQWTVNGNPAQNWTFNDLGDNKWTVTNPQDGLAWDDEGWSTTPGAVVDQWDLNSLPVQQWQLRAVGNGNLKFQNVNSGLVMAVNQQSQTPGAAITQWGDNNTPDHNWNPTQPGIRSGTYKIVATTTGNVLDGSNNSNAAGASIDLWTYWRGNNQRWYIQNLNNGYYSIRTINGDGSLGTSLDATGCSPNDGTKIEVWNSNGGVCQQWGITPVAGNAYRISTAQAKADGTHDVLDGGGCSGASGTQVDLWPWGGGSCQQSWRIQAAY